MLEKQGYIWLKMPIIGNFCSKLLLYEDFFVILQQKPSEPSQSTQTTPDCGSG
jgi:hypothetical protein